MSSHGKTIGDFFPKARWILPHAGCSRMGSFRRSWVVRELTPDNWDRSGVLYRNEDGEVVYGTVVLFQQHHEPAWQITRCVHRDGRVREEGLRPGSGNRYGTPAAAIEALNTEAKASSIVCGPIPRDEWPEDADIPWRIFSVSKGRTS